MWSIKVWLTFRGGCALLDGGLDFQRVSIRVRTFFDTLPTEMFSNKLMELRKVVDFLGW